MRVIAGSYRGRQIAAPVGKKTRPTGNKVREAVFDILGEKVAGATFLDLYAGSGAMGIEALSRGAANAVFVEGGRSASKCLVANLQQLSPPPPFRILTMGAERALRLLMGELFKADIIFADPPYADEAWPLLLKDLARSGLLRGSGCLIVEHSAHRPQVAPESLTAKKTYRYGDTSLTLFLASAPGDAVGPPCGDGAWRPAGQCGRDR